MFPLFSGQLDAFVTMLLATLLPVLFHPWPIIRLTLHNSTSSGQYPCIIGKLKLELMSHSHLEPIKVDVTIPGKACQYSHWKKNSGLVFLPILSVKEQFGMLVTNPMFLL